MIGVQVSEESPINGIRKLRNLQDAERKFFSSHYSETMKWVDIPTIYTYLGTYTFLGICTYLAGLDHMRTGLMTFWRD